MRLPETLARLCPKGVLMGMLMTGAASSAGAAARADLSSADFPTIQAAVTALPPEGGRVRIPPGLHILNGSIKPDDNVTITGAGPSTVLRLRDMLLGEAAAPLNVGDTTITLKDASGFEVGMDVFVHKKIDWGAHVERSYSYTITAIDGATLTIDKPVGFAQPAGATVCTGTPAVLVFKKRNVVVENLTIEGVKDKAPVYVNLKMAGVYLWGATDCVVRNCVIRDCRGDGISAQFPPSGIGPGKTNWDPPTVGVGNCNLIADNHIEGSSHFGIHIGGGQTRVIVRGNVARGCGKDGFYYCWDNTFAVVSDNIFMNNGRHGIGGLGAGGQKISDMYTVTSNNVCSYNGQCGIDVDGGTGNVVTGNVCHANSRSAKGRFPGIRVAGDVLDTTITGNNCSDRADDPMQKCGIEILPGAKGCVIENNVGTVQGR